MKNFLIVSLALLLTPLALVSQDIVINEVQAKNINTYSGPFIFEQYPDWVEVKNTTAAAVDISGYYLSDDEDEVTKYQFPSGTSIPANGYLIVHTVGDNFNPSTSETPTPLYATFKLASKGETIVLSAADETLISTVTYPAIQNDISYGLLSDGTYSFLNSPTPGSANDETSQFVELDSNLTVDVPSGLYATAQTVTLTKSGPGLIYYTLDGTTPTSASILYTAPITINATTVLKAIVINSASEFSVVENKSYIIGVSHSLPVIILTSDNSSFNSDNKEVIDGRAEFQFIETDGTVALNQYVNFRTSGNTSAIQPQINGKIEADDLYGDDDFDYKMYPNKTIDKFNSFLLRNSSQDWSETHLRDAYISRLLGKDNLSDIPFEGYRPAVIYVNGAYQGIINVREDDDNDYVRHNFNLDDDDYCVSENCDGGFVPFPPFTTDRAQLEMNQSFNDAVNLTFLIQFSALNEFGFRYWSNSDPEHPYTLNVLMHDFDATFGLLGENFDAAGVQPMNISQIIEPNFKNHTPYKNEAVQYIAASLNHIYSKSRTTAILNEMELELEAEIPAHAIVNSQLAVDQNYTPSNPAPFANLAEWKANVQDLRNTINARYDETTIFSEISTEYGLGSTVDVTYNSSDITMGFVRVHEIKSIDQNFTGTYFSGLPIKFSAEALPGFRFVEWVGDIMDTTNNITPSFTSNASITAVFEPIPVPTTNLVINEVQSKNDTTIADENGEFDDWIEIYNLESTPIDLAGYYLSDSPSNPLKWRIPSTGASKTTVPANGFILFWADEDLSQGENHVDFKLKGTDQVILTAPDALTIIQSISFTDLETDTSYGAETDAASNYVVFTETTPNATNNTSLSITEEKLVKYISIYPNPTKDEINISVSGNLSFEANLFDLNGKLLVSKENSNKINVNTLPTGTYLLEIKDQKTGQNIVEKVIIGQ